MNLPYCTKPVMLAGALLFSTTAGAESFRTADGQIIEQGMSTSEVLAVLGPPGETGSLFDDDINISFGGQSVKTWTYRLPGSIGGPYIVQITFEGGEVREVDAKEVSP